jgi:voltage-gated potassium channel
MGSPGNDATRGRGGDRDRVDHERFPSIGSGLWWAAQTVTTVGYGDNVPVSVGGRLLGVAVMLVGIGFLTVITAAITSTFVARSYQATQSGADLEAAEQLRQIETRLARIDAALTRSSTGS